MKSFCKHTARVKKLLSRMSLEEKLAQMQCIYVQDLIDKSGNLDLSGIGENGIGGLAFERVKIPFSPQEEAEAINRITEHCLRNTRSGIPPIIHAEALHGLCLQRATSFPQAIALAAMFDTQTMSDCAARIAEECKSRGIRQVLSPVLDLVCDPRWGRTEETYGEDHCLAAEMGVAFCTEFERRGIVTTLKHFIANSGEGGRDSAAVAYSDYELKRRFLPPYVECIRRAGAKSVMASYNAVNGIPSGVNRHLLTDILRGYCGFEGFVVTDYGLAESCKNLHKISDSLEEIAVRAVHAGVAREIPDANGGFRYLLHAVQTGAIAEEEIDRRVAEILAVKMEIGLFEQARPLCPGEILTDSPESREISLRAAEKCICLLKNDGVLPLQKGKGKTAILGAYAENPKLGGYSTWDIPVESIKDVFTECGVIALHGEGEAFAAVGEEFLCCFDNGVKVSGLFGEYKDNKDYSFQPVLYKNVKQIDYGAGEMDEFGPDKEFSVHWHGFLKAPKTGLYRFRFAANGGVSFELTAKCL